jgi:prepilin-type N-terminal cleavage/methylation domain-containing protein
MMTPRNRSSQGFSLIEMMIAMTILGFGLMGIAAMQINVMRGSQGSRDLTAAVGIARGQLEQLTRLDWSDIPVAAWTLPAAATSRVDSSVQQNDQVYMVDQRVTALVVGQTRTIDVRVSWADPRRGNRTFNLSTVKFNNGS